MGQIKSQKEGLPYMSAKVVVKHGKTPWEMAYNALEEVFIDDANGKKILLKPNIGRIGPAESGICTHPEVVRGLIRFFKDNNAGEIYVGDGAIFGVNEWEAIESSGIKKVCIEEGATPVDLDEFQPVEKLIPNGIIVDKLKFTSFIDQVDIIVSVPVIKTHMYTRATLSIKNMKGCLYKKEKTILHRVLKESPDRSKGLTLDYGIADMAEVLLPDYAVIDGIVGMEGFGPSVGTPKRLDIVLASKDPVAADYIAVELMGMDHNQVPHVNLTQERCGKTAYENIIVDPKDYIKYSKNFILPSMEKLKGVYPNVTIVEKGCCSGCSATIMSFLKTHNHKLPEDFKYILAAGKDLKAEDILNKNTFLIGICTKEHIEAGLPFCQGCPPVGSRILDTIQKEAGVLK